MGTAQQVYMQRVSCKVAACPEMKLKKKCLVDTKTNILRDLPFSQNQQLKLDND
jgi:hypothetical protein